MDLAQIAGGAACGLLGFCLSRTQPTCECHCASTQSNNVILYVLLTAVIVLQVVPYAFALCGRQRSFDREFVRRDQGRRGIVGGGGIEIIQ